MITDAAIPSIIVSELDPISKLTRDLRDAARTLSDDEARFLVDAYYAMQRDRIRAGHQERQLSVSNEPHDVMSWLAGQRETLENQVRRALDAYSGAQPAGVWARSITGIGPVIAAGLLANIDIRQAPTVGHIWRFAGLDPTVKWEKGAKRPWNGSLKRLCWLIGESFVKVSANDSDTYGKVYRARKDREIAKNDAGDFADQARASLAAKKFGADTEARKHYDAGRLPPARIHLRAERYATKLFLSHLHCVWHFLAFAKLPPKPYILTQAGHVHFLGPPNAHLVPGLDAALRLGEPASMSTDERELAAATEGTDTRERADGRARAEDAERSFAKKARAAEEGVAASMESTEDEERADLSESTAQGERAVAAERTEFQERAVRLESTACGERAECCESTDKWERAVVNEGTDGLERAAPDERTVTVRATRERPGT